MKKFISGIIVGALLFAGVSVAADGVGLTGKKVSGVYTIEKSGKLVAEAAIINGSAYAPVRAVADATGTELTVEGKRIIIQEKEAQTTVSETGTVTSGYENKRLSDIEGYTKGIENRKQKIETLETLLTTYQEQLQTATTEGEKNVAKESIADIEARLKQEREFLADAEARLAELQK